MARHARRPFRRPPARCVRAPRTSAAADKASLDEDSRRRRARPSFPYGGAKFYTRRCSACHLASLPVRWGTVRGGRPERSGNNDQPTTA